MSQRGGTWDLALMLGLVLSVGVVVATSYGLALRLLDGPWGVPVQAVPWVSAGLLARLLPRRTALELAGLVLLVVFLMWTLGDGHASWPAPPWLLLQDAGAALVCFLAPALLVGRRPLGWLRGPRPRVAGMAIVLRELAAGALLGLALDFVLVLLVFALSDTSSGQGLSTAIPVTAMVVTVLGAVLSLLPQLLRLTAYAVVLLQPALLFFWAIFPHQEPLPWGALLLLDLVWFGCLLVPGLAVAHLQSQRRQRRFDAEEPD